MSLKEDALEYHRGKIRAGKIGTDILTSVKGKDDLTLAYSPGVAAPCLEIAENPGKVYEYTNKGNTVAVVSNGSAVLGLGNIGAAAGKPVMEGKALLFKYFADVDARDVLVDSQNPDDIIEVVKLISPTYGGINLEDIKAPECFYVEEELKKILDIPVFHDDQHGTAIVVGAGLLNALKIGGKRIEDVKVIFSGAGAAGIACAKMVVELGVRKENLVMCDSKGVVYVGRDADDSKKEFAVETSKRELGEVVDGADVFVGVSKRDVLTPEMLLSMKENPAVFAMANPNPEIDYDLAKETRDDVIMSTGRSDYPNQVNNVLGFPGIFRGTLDVKARKINEDMKVAAVFAMAGLVSEATKDYIIPSPFDERVVVEVAFAVAEAAIKSGVADSSFDLEEYKRKLEMRFLREKVKAGERYRHYKGGEYEVVSVAEDSDDLKRVVVYRALYDGRIWVRDLEEFCGFSEVDGESVKRFEKIEKCMVAIKVKRLKENAVVPGYAREGDAGMDVCSTEDCVLKPGDRRLISTGLAFELPVGTELQVRPRSGLAFKHGISIVNSPGTLDSGYRGDLGIVLINHGDEDFEVKVGDRIAQVVLNKFEVADIIEVEDLSDSKRGSGGFGSTGVSNI